MTNTDQEWSVLVKAAGPAGSEPLSREQSEALKTRMPGDLPAERWVQYPPTSGRGHGCEMRLWMRGPDALEAGAAASEWFASVADPIGLGGWVVSRVHAASVAERALEVSIGLERRMRVGVTDQWNCAIRAMALGGDSGFGHEDLAQLLELLPGPDRHGRARDGMVEVRFWLEAFDAVAASAHARDLVVSALARLGRSHWRITRAQAASVAERGREVYLGVERRLSELGPEVRR